MPSEDVVASRYDPFLSLLTSSSSLYPKGRSRRLFLPGLPETFNGISGAIEDSRKFEVLHGGFQSPPLVDCVAIAEEILRGGFEIVVVKPPAVFLVWEHSPPPVAEIVRRMFRKR